jgi:hypothetical protein
MKYYINYCSPYACGIVSIYEMIKSSPFYDINKCLSKAEHLFYKVGCKYVQVIDELGEIYTEFEH